MPGCPSLRTNLELSQVWKGVQMNVLNREGTKVSKQHFFFPQIDYKSWLQAQISNPKLSLSHFKCHSNGSPGFTLSFNTGI